MFDIFVMRDHVKEMLNKVVHKIHISHLTIEYNHNNEEVINIFDVTDINMISDVIHYSNEFTRNGWKYYNKPDKAIPMNFYSYDTYSTPGTENLIATAYMDPDTYLFTRLTLGPSYNDFNYSLQDFEGLFEDIEELEITNLCQFSPEDVEGLSSLPSLNSIYLHDNRIGDLPVARVIKENLPNIDIYYGRYREIVN